MKYTFVAVLGLFFVVVAVAFAPRALLLLPAGGLVWGSLIFARHKPATAAGFGAFLVLLAATKFRVRDPMASVSGAVDAQVVMELALYGWIGALTLALTGHLRNRTSLSRAEIALGVYVTLATVSALWSPVMLLTLVRAAQLGVLLVFAFVATRAIDGSIMLRAVAAGGLAYVAVFSVAGLVLPVAAQPSPLLSGGRFSWFTVHPGAAGTYSATTSLMILAWLFFGSSKRARTRALAWIAAFLLVIVLLATRSRGPVIAFAGVSCALVLMRWGRAWSVALALFLVVASSALLLAVGASIDDVVRAAAASDAPALVYLFRDQTAEQFMHMTGRIDLWSYAAGIVRENPVFGHGYLSSRIELQAISWAGYAHNGLVQSLLDFGLMGTLLLWGAAFTLPLRAVTSQNLASRSGGFVHASVFAVVSFLLVNSMISESFSGPPAWDVALLFVHASALACSTKAAWPESSREWSDP